MSEMASQSGSTMYAVKVNGNTAKLTRVPIPTPPPTYLLARVSSVALNPTDWKHVAGSSAAPNGTAGCDFAGTVATLPTGASKTFRVGDRIAATTHGSNFSNPEDGCFAEYAVVKADLAIKIPDTLSFEKATTLPLGVSTVAQGLFQKGLKLKYTRLEGSNSEGGEGGMGESVLIYGGSTATGSLSIQFAKLAGYNVLTTCSKKNEDFVRSLGANAVYDYNEEGIGDRIRKDTGNKLKLVWDCVGQPETLAICSAALSSDDTGCRYATTNPAIHELTGRPGVVATHVLMYTIFNAAFDKMGTHYAANANDFEFAREFFNITQKLLQEDKLRTHPESVQSGGLQGVMQGMKDMAKGRVSGQKLVYRVADTPQDVAAEVQL